MERRIAAGDLRERVTILAATVTRDAYGAEALSWSASASVWARVRERGGREPLLADRPVMLISYEVLLRSGPALTNANRLTWRSKTLQIETVTPLPEIGMIMLRCLQVEL